MALIGRLNAYRWIGRFGILFSPYDLLGLVEVTHSNEDR